MLFGNPLGLSDQQLALLASAGGALNPSDPRGGQLNLAPETNRPGLDLLKGLFGSGNAGSGTTVLTDADLATASAAAGDPIAQPVQSGGLFGGGNTLGATIGNSVASEAPGESSFLERFLSQGTLGSALGAGLFGAEQFNAAKASRAKAVERGVRADEANIRLTEARTTDFLRDPAPRALKNPITLIDPDDPDSRVSLRPGSPRVDELLGMGFVVAPSRLEQGGAGDFDLRGQKGKLQIEINEQVAAINTFGSRANRLLPLIAQGGNTLVASLSNVGNRVFQEVKVLSKNFGVEFESGDEAFNTSRYSGAFSAAGLAGANPRAKAGFLGLAIQKAIASGLGTGKALSDKDIENQLISIGRNQGDPDIVRQLFTDDFNNLSDGVRFRAQASGLKLPDLVPPAFLDTPLGTTLDSDGGLVIDLTQ